MIRYARACNGAQTSIDITSRRSGLRVNGLALSLRTENPNTQETAPSRFAADGAINEITLERGDLAVFLMTFCHRAIESHQKTKCRQHDEKRAY